MAETNHVAVIGGGISGLACAYRLQQLGLTELPRFAAAVGAVTQTVSRPWHMLLVGLMFGLGFDTASEVGLLGLSASTALHRPSQTSIMILA